MGNVNPKLTLVTSQIPFVYTKFKPAETKVLLKPVIYKNTIIKLLDMTEHLLDSTCFTVVSVGDKIKNYKVGDIVVLDKTYIPKFLQFLVTEDEKEFDETIYVLNEGIAIIGTMK